MSKKWGRIISQWVALGAYCACAAVILAESAMDADSSSNQSNQVAGGIQDAIDKNYDKNAIKELKDFAVSFTCPSDFSVFVGDRVSFSVVYSPEDTSYRNLIWDYDTEDVDFSEADSSICFKRAGEIAFSVRSEQNKDLAHTYRFHCQNVPVTNLVLPTKEVNFNYGDDGLKIECSVLPENATDKSLSYFSEDEAVATVSEDGFIHPVDSGTTTIHIQSNGNSEVEETLKVTVGKKSEIVIPVSAIMVSPFSGTINENQLTLTVKGTFNDVAASFDPNLLNVKIQDSYASYFDVVSKKKTGAGQFSFGIKMKDKLLADKKNWENESIPFEVSYDLAGVAPVSSSFSVKKALIFQREDIKSVVLSSTLLSHITLKKILSSSDYIYADHVKATVNFRAGLNENDYKKSSFLFELKKPSGESYPVDTYFSSKSQNYKSYDLTPRMDSMAPEEGQLYYYPNKNDRSVSFKTEVFRYEKVEDATTGGLDFHLTKFYEDRETEFLTNTKYEKNMMSVKITVDSSNAAVKKSLESSAIELSIDNESIAEFTSSKKAGIQFKKAGVTILRAKSAITGLEKEYKIRGVDAPNRFKTLINTKPVELDYSADPIVEIGKDERKTIDLVCSYQTTFADGTTVTTPIETALSLEIEEGQEDHLALAENSCTLQGIRQNSGASPIPLKLLIHRDDTVVKTLMCGVRVTYIAVDRSSFDVAFETTIEANEYNQAQSDCSSVPVGTVFQAHARMNEDATNKRVSFSSSKSDVIAINPKTGLAKALKAGEAVINVISEDNNAITYSKKIRVTNTVSPFELDMEKMAPSKYDVVKKEDGSVDYYRVDLEYARPYQIYIKTLASSTSGTWTFRRLASNEGQTSCIRIDKAGHVSSTGIGEDAYEIIYGGEDSLQTYKQVIRFHVARNSRFTYQQLSILVRKSLGHFGLFAFTAIFSVIFIFFAFRRAWVRYAALGVSGVLGFSLAGFSELIQLYTPGRACAWKDVGIDSAGYMTTILLAAFVFSVILLVRFVIHKKQAKKKDTDGE